MKKLIIILGLLFAFPAFAGIECYKTLQECLDKVPKTAEEQSHFFCFVSPDPNQCVSDKTAIYNAKEIAKYKIRHSGQNPSADYIMATNTPILAGVAQNQTKQRIYLNFGVFTFLIAIFGYFYKKYGQK